MAPRARDLDGRNRGLRGQSGPDRTTEDREAAVDRQEREAGPVGGSRPDDVARSERDPRAAAHDEHESASDLVRQIEERTAPDRRTQPDRRAVARKRGPFWTRFLVFAAVTALLVTLPPYLVGRGGPRIEFPPDELVGTWSTDDPRYADRGITISEDDLRLEMGSDGQATYPIEAIHVEVADVHRMYTIHYLDGDDELSMDIFVFNDGSLRLRNPSEVRWTREPG